MPTLIDLFCGGGGAGAGYYLAGFDRIIGIDIADHSQSYPGEFIKGDWTEALAFLPGLLERESEPYAIHASPPCQHYSRGAKQRGTTHDWPDLIGDVREALKNIGVPFVIENLPEAPLENPIRLCGSMFGLGSQERQLIRHRDFETNWCLVAPGPCKHDRRRALTVAGHSGGSSTRDGITVPQVWEWKIGMGIDWMRNRRELAEAVPPAYTKWIGKQLLKVMGHA